MKITIDIPDDYASPEDFDIENDLVMFLEEAGLELDTTFAAGNLTITITGPLETSDE